MKKEFAIFALFAAALTITAFVTSEVSFAQEGEPCPKSVRSSAFEGGFSSSADLNEAKKNAVNDAIKNSIESCSGDLSFLCSNFDGTCKLTENSLAVKHSVPKARCQYDSETKIYFCSASAKAKCASGCQKDVYAQYGEFID